MEKIEIFDNVALGLGITLATNESFAYNTLIWVFRYLNCMDLFSCAEVCPVWQWVVGEYLAWRQVPVYCCPNHIEKAIKLFGSKLKNVEIINARFLSNDIFREICSQLENLQQIGIHGSHINQLQILSEHNRKLQRIKARIYWGKLTKIDFFKHFEGLTHLDITTHNKICDVTFLYKLTNLRHLTFFAPCDEALWEDIAKLENLESLGVYADLESTWISTLFENNFLIRYLKKLKQLHIKNLPYFHEYDILEKIKLMPHITELNLENVSISRAGTSSFGALLGQCNSLERLTIRISRVVFYDSILDVAMENSEIVNGAIALKDKLKYFCWNMDELGLSPVESFFALHNITAIKSNIKQNLRASCSIKGVIPISIPKLLGVLQEKLPNTKVVLTTPSTILNQKKDWHCFGCSTVIITSQHNVKTY